jgi:hypothetical protein
MAEGERPRKDWSFRIAAVILVAVIAGVLIYMFVPPLLTYERLVMYSFYGWSSNAEGQIKQVTFNLWNNGTRDLRIKHFLVNGTVVGSDECGFTNGLDLDADREDDFYIVPKSWSFAKGACYNFTAFTTSGNSYSFLKTCDDSMMYPENFTFINWRYSQGFSGEPTYIAVRYRNGGRSPLIIVDVLLNGGTIDYYTGGWTWPAGWTVRGKGPETILLIYSGMKDQPYTVTIRTAIGNTYETTFQSTLNVTGGPLPPHG